MECALEFKEIIEGQFPQYRERFQRIWSGFLANRSALEQIYGQLPVSVFQADLNATNILLDDEMRFAGVLDFNLCGRDTVLNVLFRELWINFDEDIPDKRENNMYYIEENSEKSLESFLHNLHWRRFLRLYAAGTEGRAAALLVSAAFLVAAPSCPQAGPERSGKGGTNFELDRDGTIAQH